MSEDEVKKFAKRDLNGFVDNFCYRADVLFDILQKSLHKSAFHVNGKYTVITIQRKVYCEGTSIPSPTRKDVKELIDPNGSQGGLADGKF